MRFGKPLAFPLFLVAVIGLALIVAEWWILPGMEVDLPRDVLLMGFYANPSTRVDDVPISAMGFAGDAIEIEKPAEVVRVLTLGGSAMFNRRMTGRLHRALDRVSPRPVEIVGAALRTHTSASSVLKYEVLAGYGFDFVLIYHAINDLWANHVPPDRFETDYGHLGPLYDRNLLLDHSLLARSLQVRFIHSKQVPYHSLKRREENAAGFASVETFRRNLTTLIDAVRRNGGTPILMTFAWSIPAHYSLDAFRSGSVGYNNPTHYDRFGAKLWGAPDYVREGLERHNRVIHDLAAERDVLLIDQEELIGKELFWFGDICHFSDEGTERFVGNIAAFFTEQRLFEP